MKLDKVPVEVMEASCFPDAVELLLACFFVFNVQYPYVLKPFFEILETLLGLRKAPSAAVAREILRRIA